MVGGTCIKCRMNAYAQPLSEEEVQQVLLVQHQLIRDMKQPLSMYREPLTPFQALAYFFYWRPSNDMLKLVRAAYLNRKTDGPGYVYVMHNSNDVPEVLKIGHTVNVTNRRTRIENMMGTGTVTVVYAYKSVRRRLCEKIVHHLLAHRRLPKRPFARVGKLSTEFFVIPEWRSLQWLVKATCRHVDWSIRAGLV